MPGVSRSTTTPPCALPAPRRTFLVHGEPAAARGMAEMLRASRGWATHVPALGETVELET
jgi:metallo-beta-lactamase family protein